jgi:hypothetical protein
LLWASAKLGSSSVARWYSRERLAAAPGVAQVVAQEEVADRIVRLIRHRAPHVRDGAGGVAALVEQQRQVPARPGGRRVQRDRDAIVMLGELAHPLVLRDQPAVEVSPIQAWIPLYGQVEDATRVVDPARERDDLGEPFQLPRRALRERFLPQQRLELVAPLLRPLQQARQTSRRAGSSS